VDESAPEVVVVTGTGGMGMAIARRLGAGRAVVLADNRRDQLDAAVDALAADGHKAVGVPTDVSDPAAVTALVDAALERGWLRCLAHTAGVSPVKASAAQIMAVDAIGTAQILDAFEAAVRPGTVGVFVASMAGTLMTLPPDVEDLLATTPTAELSALPALDPKTLDPGLAYGIAKRANQLRIQAASLTWGVRGGRVVSLSPGVISTPMGIDELAGPSGDFMRMMIQHSGTGRAGTPDDIAAVVEFLTSPAASFITGTDILVDGGAVAAVRRSPVFRTASSPT
jgi:NAD(P)-dependent dehydrogenase (short-subunit alcohol dehydrogenase family)